MTKTAKRCRVCGRLLELRPKGKGRQRTMCDDECKAARAYSWVVNLSGTQRRTLRTLLDRIDSE